MLMRSFDMPNFLSVARVMGRVVGVQSDIGVHPKADDNPRWIEFVDWNAVQPVPLDLSDRAPDPPPADPGNPATRPSSITSKRRPPASRLPSASNTCGAGRLMLRMLNRLGDIGG